MPNRIIKESICTSENLDSLTAFQETMFYRLIVNCDDYGRMDARPKILAAKLFPLKEIRSSQMEDALRALTSAELVNTYYVDGKPFLQMKTWEQHQTVRAKRSKYPSPQAHESTCKQMQADVCKCSRNPIQSESESNPNPYPNPYPNPSADATTTTTDGMPFGLTEADIDASLSQDQRIEDACKTWALPCSAGNIAESRDLIREYGEEWVMQAIQIAGNNKPTWGYVKGVLATAKRNGSMDLPQKRTGKTVSAQQYQQRNYTEEELLAVGDDLIAEARRRRGTNRS